MENLSDNGASETISYCGDPDQINRCLRTVTGEMQGRPRDSVSLAERLRIYDFEVDRAALNVLLLKCRSCAAKRILKVNETLSFIPEDNAAGTTGTST